MDKDQLRLYRALSRGPFPKSYVGKVFFTAYLAHFAEVLNWNVRAADWVARWGGDEFVVCMWNTQQGQPTEHVLERIGEDLRRNPVVLPDGEEARLTFSGGVPVEAGGRRPRADLTGRRSRLPGQGRRHRRVRRLTRLAAGERPGVGRDDLHLALPWSKGLDRAL